MRRSVQTRGLQIGDADDAFEHEADRIADQVAQSGVVNPSSRLSFNAGANSTAQGKSEGNAPQSSSTIVPAGGGTALDPSTREFMEGRFGQDFSHVRVHSDSESAVSARSIGARAYTVGSDIYFGSSEFDPESKDGRRLLAHELTHTLQQRDNALRVQRDPVPTPAPAQDRDPICAGYDHKAMDKTIDGQIKDYQATKERLPLIRSLKMARRCATSDDMQQTRGKLDSSLAKDATGIWNESATAFGGYTGFYPGFAPDIKTHLEKLGASEALAASSFELSGSGSTHRSRAAAKGKAEVADLARTDIVYFRGHQYAQYRAPGLFANGDETYGFDLRYVEKVGGFANVKIMISTSCATLCKEALDVFTALFPNAVILGYRKSAPINGGAVRDALRDKLNALNKPLLLDQPLDIASIIDVWKSVIESKHKGETAPVPGYYISGNVHYWDGASWGVIAPSDPQNMCKRKGDFSAEYPPPP